MRCPLGKLTGNFAILGPQKPISLHETTVLQRLFTKFPTQINRENILKNREFLSGNREFHCKLVSVHFSHTCCPRFGRDLFSPMNFQKRGHNMPDKFRTRERYGEAFWRKHHEAWQQSALNQREYCEARGIPLKAFGNWRGKVQTQPRLWGTELFYPSPGRRSTLIFNGSHNLYYS